MESHLETKFKLILVVPDFSISKFCISVKVFVVHIIFLTEEESHSKVISAALHSEYQKDLLSKIRATKLQSYVIHTKLSEPTGNAHSDSVSTSDIILEGISTSEASLLHY